MKTFEEYLEGYKYDRPSPRSEQSARRRANLPVSKIGTGIFNMELANEIENVSLEQGKQMALDVIDKNTTASEKNIEDARRKVLQCTSKFGLMKMMTDAILAVQGHNTVKL